MTAQLIYLVGQPGAGKSTLMASLTEEYDRVPGMDNGLAMDELVNPATGDILGVEIGKRRELFSGTDALPSSIIDKAAPWISGVPYPLVLAEGARLANRRFLDAALDAGYHVTLVLLDHDDVTAWHTKRTEAIGREQNPSWVKGRLSASRNLADHYTNKAATADQITVLRGHPDELEAQLRDIMASAS